MTGPQSELDRLDGVAVLVVGDVMLDEYLWGEVERLSPEAPVPVVRVARRTWVPGGAGNAAVAVAALGGHAILVGVAGQDEPADRLRAALKQHHIGIDGLLPHPGRMTTVKSRLLARGQHVVRTDSEDRDPLDESVRDELLSFVRARVEDADAVLVSDYGKGVVSDQLARAVIEEAGTAGIPVIVDPTGTAYAKYAGARILTPSSDELGAAVGRLVRTDPELHRAATELADLVPRTDVLVTRGPDGMRWIRSGHAPLDIPARARSVFDVTGAGDTVAAAIAVALGAGLGTETALHLANTAAGLVVGKVGTAYVSRSELDDQL